MFDILKRLIRKKETVKDPLDSIQENESEELHGQSAEPLKKHKETIRPQHKKESFKKNKSELTEIPKSVSRPQKKYKKQKHQLNKHGLPVFQKDSDISAFFQEKKNPPSAAPPTLRKKPKQAVKKREKKRKKHPPKNRHGIPVFSEQTDFSIFFTDDSDVPPSSMESEPEHSKKFLETPEEENFEELLEQSLSGKTSEILLQEKKDAMPPDRPLTRKEKLRCYPPPQDELDLHGCTAQEAVEQTELFIRTARHRGKRTLLIIVGRGIHSRHKAVLPDVVETKIIELKRKNLVMTFEWEKGRKHKSGAVIVYLNPF